MWPQLILHTEPNHRAVVRQ